MGMIMKDGIPYGGIYPIDDAPTQGSNNAVKSGGVHSALSNKVDKVAGKGLSTNDYDNTEKEQNEANADAIEAIVNRYGSKNLAPFPNFYTKVEQGVTWTVIRENGSNNGKVTAVGTASAWSVVSTKNFFLHAGSYVISAGASDIYHCYVQLANISDSSLVATTYGKFSVSFELTHDAELRLDYVIYEGATVNDVFACMIRDVRITDPTYVPYSMTNRELTEKLTYTIVYPTANDNAITDYLFNHVYKIGCLVIISFGCALKANIVADTVLLSDLPIPIYEPWFGSLVSPSHTLRVKVNGDGELIAENPITAIEWFSGNIVYITNA